LGGNASGKDIFSVAGEGEFLAIRGRVKGGERPTPEEFIGGKKTRGAYRPSRRRERGVTKNHRDQRKKRGEKVRPRQDKSEKPQKTKRTRSPFTIVVSQGKAFRK